MLDTWGGGCRQLHVRMCVHAHIYVCIRVLFCISALPQIISESFNIPAWLQHVLQNVFSLRAARVECVYHRLLDGALITIIKPFDSQGVLFLGLSFDNKKKREREGSSLRSGCRNCWLALSLPDSHWRAPASLKVTPL